VDAAGSASASHGAAAALRRRPNRGRGAAIFEYFTVGRTVDELFDDEIRLILRG